MKKKIVSLLMCAAVVSGLLAANVQASAGEDAAIEGKLVIWEHTAQFEQPLKEVIAGFNEKYPNVEVEYTFCLYSHF